ncbi:MAG: trypsin-like peptidase domain-containing protein [Planctomycetota bacterium]
MTKRRILRSIILAIVCIVAAIFIAFIYTALTDELRTLNNVSKSADANNVPQIDSQKQEIEIDVGIVTAIMYVDGTPLAVVDGVILREGQSIRQVKVIKINPDSVEFEYEGTRWSQQVNKPSSTQCISTINKRMLSKNMSVEDIVKYTSPSVVLIVAYDDTGDQITFGSGFFIGSGKILTNAHVIEDAYSAEVQSLLETYTNVTIIKCDDDLDLAVLEVQSVGEPIISLNDDGDVCVGQKVLVIGNPLGLERIVSDGIISAMRNSDGIQEIQITAPISGGSSGSPLLNMQGLVIGVVYAGYDAGQNLNLSVGIDTVKKFLRTPDNPVQLARAGSFIPGKVVKKWIKYLAIGVVALAIVVTLFVYILKKIYWIIVTPFRRARIPNAVKVWEEQDQILGLSKENPEKTWRSL